MKAKVTFEAEFDWVVYLGIFKEILDAPSGKGYSLTLGRQLVSALHMLGMSLHEMLRQTDPVVAGGDEVQTENTEIGWSGAEAQFLKDAARALSSWELEPMESYQPQRASRNEELD